MAIALFALFMFGGSFGRAECSGSAGCGEVSVRMVTCITGNAMPCVCACIVVDTMIETGLRVAVAIEPLVAQMPLGSGTLTEPELPPPRI